MWDTNQLLSSAQSSNLQQYKPEADDTLSFQELKEINDEVIAWLTVYGTKIDYPVTQADNDQKYVNTSVLGKYSLAGSIFYLVRTPQIFLTSIVLFMVITWIKKRCSAVWINSLKKILQSAPIRQSLL